MESQLASSLECIHYVPGRLRVRVASLKGNRTAAAAIGGTLGRTVGVTSTAVSHVTGNVVILYDQTRTTAEKVLSGLSEGYGVRSGLPATSRRDDSLTRAATWLSEKAVEKALEMAVEKSLLLLLAVVL